jgi:integrase
MRMYESQYSRLVEWTQANRPEVKELRQVTPETAKDFARHLGETLSGNSFNKYMTLFRRVWKVLYIEARLTCNPWDKDEIRPKQEAAHSRRELTLEELAAVCAPLSGEMRSLFAVGLYTGLRLGDAVRLDWGDVDIARGVLSVVPHKPARKAAGKRVLRPIHKTLAGILEETPAPARRCKVMPELAAQYDASTADLSKKIQAVFARCGIETASKSGGGRAAVNVGFHSLRHTFVSLSANAGTPLAVVQAIVGHSNPAMTRHYFHESKESLRIAVDALPDVSGVDVAPDTPDAAQVTTIAPLDRFRALVDGMTKEELKQAQAYIKTRKGK